MRHGGRWDHPTERRPSARAARRGLLLLLTLLAMPAAAGAQPAQAPAEPERTIAVLPVDGWTETGIYVDPGDRLVLRTVGRILVGAAPYGPAGREAGEDEARPLPEARHGALIGRIGDRIFLVGDGYDGLVESGGSLLLGVNLPPVELRSGGLGWFRVFATRFPAPDVVPDTPLNEGIAQPDNAAAPVETPTTAVPVETPTTAVPVEAPIAAAPVEAPIAAVPVEAPIAAAPVETPIAAAPVEAPIAAATPARRAGQAPAIPPVEEAPAKPSFPWLLLLAALVVGGLLVLGLSRWHRARMTGRKKARLAVAHSLSPDPAQANRPAPPELTPAWPTVGTRWRVEEREPAFGGWAGEEARNG